MKHEAGRAPLIAGLFGIAGLLLYGLTSAPSVATVFDDSLEFQVVLPTLGIAHPSGYPLYTLVGKLFTLLVPLRDPAGRANLLSALAAAGTVAIFYLLALRLTHSRLPAVIATTAFAISPAWWSQATLAEVYTLHGLLMVAFSYCLLRWEDAITLLRVGGGRVAGVTEGAGGQAKAAFAPAGADRWLAAAGLLAGLGLSHHRMIALLLPAALVLILWADPGIMRQPRRWIRPILFGLAPLLLYLYLPIRGQAISSLDGSYRASLSGTLDWILARAYGVFLSGNPFNVHRTAGTFVALFLEQFGPLPMLAALWGIATGWRFATRRYVFLLVATLATVAFGVAYKVEDIEVFFIPAFILTGLWIGLGLVSVFDSYAGALAARARQIGLPSAARPWVLDGLALLLSAALLFEPVRMAVQGFAVQNRSQAWGVYDSGQDALANIAPDGEVIGLLGETTLLRYFRDVLGQRRDITLVAADAEGARFAAVASGLARGAPVYLTRDLPGVSRRYSLNAAGPLIQVSAKPAPAAAAPGQEMGDGIRLLGAKTSILPGHSALDVRVTVTWTASVPVSEALKVSARLMRPGNDAPLVANDQAPVHFAYPTTDWVTGQPVQDVYDLALPTPTPPGNYKVLLILYRAADGKEVGRAELPAISLAGADTGAPTDTGTAASH
jgi:Protein of unknown function (DUF2723)